MRVALAVLLGACSFSSGGNPANPDAREADGGESDAAVDAMSVDCAVWGPRRYFDACAMPAVFENPASPPNLSVAGTYVIDTTAGEVTPPGMAAEAIGSIQTLTDVSGRLVEVHLLVVRTLTVPDDVVLRLVGSRPLVIASSQDITVTGDIDLSARHADPDMFVPAGSGVQNDGLCSNNLDGDDDDNGGAGGAGGAMAFAGGDGQISSSGSQTVTTGGVAHYSGTSELHGGCPGGQGGEGDRGAGGVGGGGGGALLLSAVGTIITNGTIHANGSEGRGQVDTVGDDRRHGGGGGGSGGLVALEAPMVRIAAGSVIVSNGGGGGGGANNMIDAALHGTAGRLDTTRAAGGVGEMGADGGLGGARDTGAVASFAGGAGSPSGDRGGGGGGGSCGTVLVIAPSSGFGQAGVVSPIVTLEDPPT